MYSAEHESRVTSHKSHRLDVRAALKQAMARLRAARVPSHTLAAELLLTHVLGRDRAWLYAHPEEAVAAHAAQRYFALIDRRIEGVPTQYLTGWQEFWGLQFEVGPGVLIPRPETEHVIEVALARLGPPDANDPRPRGTGMRIADVGAGSGCIAIALARELPGARIYASDISAGALAYAHRNAAHHGVVSRVHLICCDSLTCFSTESRVPSPEPLPFDVIVSNPPYIGRREANTLPKEVRAHEPHQALFAGEQGHEFYAPLVDQARNLLRPGGLLVVELGYNAVARVLPLLDAPGDWAAVEVTQDLAGIPRVLAAAARQRN